jgi:hypothetical protein
MRISGQRIYEVVSFRICAYTEVYMRLYAHIRKWSTSVYTHIRKPTISIYVHIQKWSAFHIEDGQVTCVTCIMRSVKYHIILKLFVFMFLNFTALY